MSVKINADTTNGAVITSDTSGEIELQAGGTKIATVDSSGITMASGKTLPAASLTGTVPSGVTVNSSSLSGALPALDGSSLTGLGTTFTGADIYRSGAVNVTSGAWRLLILNGQNYKTSDINYDAASGKLTPQKAGYYLFVVEWNSNVTHSDRTAIYKNGSAMKYGRYNDDGNSSKGGGVTAIGYANGSTDYFQAYVNVGATKTLTTGAANTWMSIAYLGA